MSAAEQLARWREAEQGATEGPWTAYRHGYGVGIEGPVEDEQLIVETYGLTYPVNPTDADFIAAARTAMPALLAFAEAVLALHQPMEMLHEPSGREVRVCAACGDDYHEKRYPCPTVRLAEQHLGSASS